jgi:DNA-binding YbaB/EbfC family protein
MAKGFKGFPGGGNMQGLLEQAQQMQRAMARVQEEAEVFEAEGSAGGGAVKVVANGKNELVSVSLQPELLEPDNQKMLEETIVIAANVALAKVKQNTQQKMATVTGGLSIPGLT